MAGIKAALPSFLDRTDAALKQADEALQALAQLPPNSQRQTWGLASVKSLLF